ncbi:MAG TPA: hypothetical protein VK504_10000 [Vicinamibacterales bacterium]|nr:hypothetical protein [Vicinamibacterales bacterium]
MTLLCWMDGPTLTLRNDGDRALSLGQGTQIAIDFAADAPATRCEGFSATITGSRLVLTSTRRERWWYPRALLVIKLPATATSVEFEGTAYAIASEPPAERRTGSVIINTFTCDPVRFENITAPATVYLTWSTTNASAVTLSSAGKVNNSQTRLAMIIEETTTFVLTAYDSALDQIDSQSVTVVVDPPLVSRLVPPGTIAIWSGTEADKPDGWFICNGENGTPDLQDRFVMGAGGTEQPGDFGEEQTHTHEVPAAATSSRTGEEPDHQHLFPGDWYGRDFEDGDWSGIDTNGDFIKGAEYTQLAGKHSHSYTATIPAVTSHTNSGSVRPRWFALLYIMKGK